MAVLVTAKLGFEVAESTVSKYMIRRRGPPSQSWGSIMQTPLQRMHILELSGEAREIAGLS
jgi:hypothetical protein